MGVRKKDIVISEKSLQLVKKGKGSKSRGRDEPRLVVEFSSDLDLREDKKLTQGCWVGPNQKAGDPQGRYRAHIPRWHPGLRGCSTVSNFPVLTLPSVTQGCSTWFL